jgi:mannose/cellobiose epimerase-like protein (N-acyl-D-glucosamine 2-epimerase family)
MNRRQFFAGAAAAAAAASVDKDAARGQGRRGARRPPAGGGMRLAGLPLVELRGRYRRQLFEDFLPFMERHVIDREYGGFMCMTGHDGSRQSDKKSSWFEGRGTWVYAFLYNNLARERKYLDVARRSIDLVMRSEPSGDELWPKEMTREGRPLTSADGEIYGDLFVAEGLAELSKATGQRGHWDKAKGLVLKCVRLYDRPDYRPSIGQTYLGPAARPFPGARIQGVWMVLVRVVTQMLEMRPDPELEAIARRAVDAVVNYHYNPEFGLINELLDHDLSRPANEYAQLVYTGHCLENLWMLMAEAARLRDRPLFEKLSGWLKRHAEVAWDDVYGGYFRNLQHVDNNTWLTDKVLWAQEEVLIGSLFVVEHAGEPWAEELFARTYRYVLDKYPLDRRGSPLWMYASDRKASFEAFLKMPRRVENYHHPRHLMLNLLALDRVVGRGGRVSGRFG